MYSNSPQIPPPEYSFLFCGGGSGGHLFPAIAVCEELKETLGENCRFLFTTTGKQIEQTAISNQNIDIETVHIPSTSLGHLKRHPFRGGKVILSAFRQARNVIKETCPAVVIGLGGYGSVPGILAAKSLGKPILLMEQNTLPGSANIFLARFSDRICTSFPGTTNYFTQKDRIIETGNPVRTAIRNLSRHRNADRPPTLTVLGGSQGAIAINDAMLLLIEQSPELFSGWTVYHQTGTSDNQKLIDAYQSASVTAFVSPFFTNMEELLSKTTFAISRAGATTLAELAVLGIPSVLVPYPNSARNHQQENAIYYSNNNAASTVEQQDNVDHFATQLKKELKRFTSSEELRNSMSQNMLHLGTPQAANLVKQQILKLSQQGSLI